MKIQTKTLKVEVMLRWHNFGVIWLKLNSCHVSSCMTFVLIKLSLSCIILAQLH